MRCSAPVGCAHTMLPMPNTTRKGAHNASLDCIVMIGIVCSIGSYTQHARWLFYTAYALHTQLVLLDIIFSLNIEYSPKCAGKVVALENLAKYLQHVFIA